MSVLHLGAIVEGHGEVRAAPILVHRIASEWDPTQTVIVKPVVRSPSSWLKKPGALESEVENVVRRLGGMGGVLVLLDCDWHAGCPKFDGPPWLKRAREARRDVPISVVFAYREFEAWFIAAAESIRGYCGLPLDLVPDPRPEAIRNAKGWLTRHMPRNRPYAETTDQPALTRAFDMHAARRTDSFDKCYREIVKLLTTLKRKDSGHSAARGAR
ncbi:MAG: DUF4276 family protein [Planctomycetes bacterium]|nr:DUF4276 family protein [Planctomycetota bacterium]